MQNYNAIKLFEAGVSYVVFYPPYDFLETTTRWHADNSDWRAARRCFTLEIMEWCEENMGYCPKLVYPSSSNGQPHIRFVDDADLTMFVLRFS